MSKLSKIDSIPINKILCRHWLRTERIRELNLKQQFDSCLYIKDTIHYNALVTKDYSTYKFYVEDTEQKEHSVEIFKNLYDNFDLSKMKKIKVYYDRSKQSYIVTDGVHRLSILLYKNIIGNSIPIKFLDIK